MEPSSVPIRMDPLSLTARALPSGRADRGREKERSTFADPKRSVGLRNAPAPGSVSPAVFHGDNHFPKCKSSAVRSRTFEAVKLPWWQKEKRSNSSSQTE